jgi:hypothetical protein
MSEMLQLDAPSAEASHSFAWCDHFRRNVDRQIEIPWDAVAALAEPKRHILIPSLQDFQLGESSEGKHGLARAAAYGQRVNDPHYAEAVRLFFAEENRHAAYLARYLRSTGAETIGRSWTDSVFRRVRRLLGLELLITVLLTAELIGEVYYRAIHAATDCHTLRALCAQILRDERQHVRFHIERFVYLRSRRSKWVLWMQNTAWRTFFRATCLAVWSKHRHAFRVGGYSLRRFWTEATERLDKAIS